MVMPRPTELARELWRLLEPLHAVTYFAPEPVAALREAGYKGFWMGYFAGRAAPLGPVGAGVVHALFYNFTYARVARALPDAWGFAPPGAALEARVAGSVAALERAFDGVVTEGEVARAAELASRVALAQPAEGRVLYAANRSLPEPDRPLARLWHAATLVREHRGDGHVAVLVAEGVGGRESHVLHALDSGTPRDVYAVAREFDDVEWAACLESLRRKGLVDGDQLSPAGVATKQRVEARTDECAAAGIAALSDAEAHELVTLLRPMASAVVRAGDIPLRSPMGLDLRNLT